MGVKLGELSDAPIVKDVARDKISVDRALGLLHSDIAVLCSLLGVSVPRPTPKSFAIACLLRWSHNSPVRSVLHWSRESLRPDSLSLRLMGTENTQKAQSTKQQPIAKKKANR